MNTDGIGTEQLAIFILGAAMIAVGYLGLTGALTVSNILSGAGASTIAILAFSLGRQRGQPDGA
jgi:hypothetical protein